ncbi:SCAN domain-containing protein 3-like 17, partial [Homarus americanus]
VVSAACMAHVSQELHNKFVRFSVGPRTTLPYPTLPYPTLPYPLESQPVRVVYKCILTYVFLCDIKEEYLFCTQLETTTTAVDMMEKLSSFFTAYRINWENCCGLNRLNLKLQGKERNVFYLMDCLRAFLAKLQNWQRKVNTGNVAMFENLSTVLDETEDHLLDPSLKTEITQHLKSLEYGFPEIFIDLSWLVLFLGSRQFTSNINVSECHHDRPPLYTRQNIDYLKPGLLIVVTWLSSPPSPGSPHLPHLALLTSLTWLSSPPSPGSLPSPHLALLTSLTWLSSLLHLAFPTATTGTRPQVSGMHTLNILTPRYTATGERYTYLNILTPRYTATGTRPQVSGIHTLNILTPRYTATGTRPQVSGIHTLNILTPRTRPQVHGQVSGIHTLNILTPRYTATGTRPQVSGIHTLNILTPRYTATGERYTYSKHINSQVHGHRYTATGERYTYSNILTPRYTATGTRPQVSGIHTLNILTPRYTATGERYTYSNILTPRYTAT